MSFLNRLKSITPSFEGVWMLLKRRQKSSTVLNSCTFICEFVQLSFVEWLCSSTHRHQVCSSWCFFGSAEEAEPLEASDQTSSREGKKLLKVPPVLSPLTARTLLAEDRVSIM